MKVKFFILPLLFIEVFGASTPKSVVAELDCRLAKPRPDIYYNLEHSAGNPINIYDCELPHLIPLNSNVTILSKNVRNARIWINDADIFVMINENAMPLYFPLGIGDQFFGMKSLRVMMSALKVIERENLKNMKSLKNLHLVGNQIEEIPVDTFYDLPNLSELMMDHNQISELHNDIFTQNPNLKYIKLASNKLQSLPSGLFRNNLELESINFRNNDFVDVQVDFRPLSKLFYVNLDSRMPHDGKSVCKLRFSESNENSIDEFQRDVEKFCKNLNS